MSAVASRRVVLTGVGFVSPLGCGSEWVWQRLLQGKGGIVSLKEAKGDDLLTKTRQECGVHLGAIVPRGSSEHEFDARSAFGASVDREVALFSQFAVVAGDIALMHAGLPSPTDFKAGVEQFINLDRAGVSMASGIGAMDVSCS